MSLFRSKSFDNECDDFGYCFIKKMLPLLMLVLLQIANPVLTVTRSENIVQIPETTTAQSIITATTTENNNNNNNNLYNKNNNIKNQQQEHSKELYIHEQIIDNSIDFTVDPCDDFYQYACGEWKQQLYDEKPTTTTKQNTNADANADVDADAVEDDVLDIDNDDDDHDHDEAEFKYLNDSNGYYKYDRTLAMIDYLADKEVLKYFYEKNQTKYAAINKNASSTTTTTNTTKENTIKEPDFIIKVYKYYKSCVSIQQYEPIKYLEWLELNEHVKWPSLINTTNNEEYDESRADNADEHENANTNPSEQAFEGKYFQDDEEDEEVTEILMDYDENDNNDTANDANIDAITFVDNDELEEDYNSTWIYTLAVLRKYGLNSIFVEEIIYTTKTSPSKLFLGFNKPITEGGFKSLKIDNLKTILQHLNETYTSETFKELWLKVTKFEWQLIKLNDYPDELGTKMIPIEHLPVDWLGDYLMITLNLNQPLDLNMHVFITNAAYFMALDHLLKEYDNNFLKKYLKIRFVWHLYQREPQEFSPLDCIQHIKQYQPLAFEWIYEQRHMELKQEIPEILNMYSNIRRQFNLTLYSNRNNFNTTTLEKFVNKLERTQLKVGTFIDVVPQDFFYENRKFYKALKLSSRNYYANHLKMLKFNFDCIHFELSNIGPDSIYYDMKEHYTGLASAAYFNHRLNTINMPLSLLQPPIYHPQFSDIYRYSSLGFILSQTLMYGFNLNDLPNDDHSFKCLKNLVATEVDDKIADVSGFRLAYHTFFHTNNQNLISNRKIFFLNFAQSFCATQTSDDTLGRSYVNYALAQFNEFAKVFDCPPDSHMNPHEKCYLWD